MPEGITPEADDRRYAFRAQVNDHFARRRRSAESDAFLSSFDQARQLMERRDVFDVSKEPAKDQERYGNSEFGRQCLLARRLVEQGVSCVQVTHSNYDTHYENFDFHIEQLGEFDRPFATLVADLVERGLWEKTLVVVMSEFGRTPNINQFHGRDHWGTAWSVAPGWLRHPARRHHRQDQRQWHRSRRSRGRSRASVPHVSECDGRRLDRRVRRRRPQAADGRSGRRAHHGAPGMNDAQTRRRQAAAHSGSIRKLTHAAGEWKYTSPLLSCRFDPSGQFVFCSAQDNSVQRWNIASGQATAAECAR